MYSTLQIAEACSFSYESVRKFGNYVSSFNDLGKVNVNSELHRSHVNYS